MAEMPNIDPNFEPQPRPRSGTWPMNRPNIPPRRRMQEVSNTMLEPTLEEANSQELIAVDQSMLEPSSLIKDDYLQMLDGDAMSTDLDNVLMGLPPAPTANLVEDFPTLSGAVKFEPNNNNSILNEYCTSTTITELSTLNAEQTFDNIQNLQQQAAPTPNFSPGTSSNPSLSKSPPKSVASPTMQPTVTGATPKAKSTRKNAWGNMSYADLITQAIESAPDKRLTLAQVYEWMVKNVPYFKDKGDSNSSAGWKNSIRHNLSLHAKFKRIQNEGTGKSSWWVINHDAKPGKSPRRRAISMDNQNAKGMRQRSKLAKQKADILKKQKAGLKSGDSATWGRDGASSIETAVSKAMGSGYRVRTGSNASSIGGRISPSHLYPPQDLEDDGAPTLSPLGSASNLMNLPTSLPTAFNIFNAGRPEKVPDTVAEDGISVDPQEKLLKSLANMDVVSSAVPYNSVDSKAGMYMQQHNGTQQNSGRKNLSSNVAQNSPNLASLLQKNTKSPMKTTSIVTKREPDWTDSKTPYGYPEYQSPQMINPVLQSPSQFKSPIQPRYGLTQQNLQETPPQYSQSGIPQQVNYIQQQPGEMQQYLVNQQRQQQMVQDGQQLSPQYVGEQSNLLRMGQGKFPSDINLETQDFYDSGEIDMAQVLVDIPPNEYPYDFGGMDFQTGGKPTGLYNQLQMQESNDYGMGNNSMMQQQQPPLAMHPNPDVFIANQGPGTISMGMMMDGCRMNNGNFQRGMQSDRAHQSVLPQHISSSRNAN